LAAVTVGFFDGSTPTTAGALLGDSDDCLLYEIGLLVAGVFGGDCEELARDSCVSAVPDGFVFAETLIAAPHCGHLTDRPAYSSFTPSVFWHAPQLT